jgi:septum formation protein
MSTNRQQPDLILASKSPRRIELLQQLGLSFDVIPSDLKENIDLSLSPAQVVVSLAKQKSNHVTEQLKPTRSKPFVVLGADTLVVLEKHFLGKPSSKEDAFDMLASLSGKVHEVYTGVVLIGNIGNDQNFPDESTFQVSRVYFRHLSPQEINAYIATGEPMDKAGAYAVQGIASAFIEKIEGCYTNIIGLPIPPVVRMLRKAGIKVLGK